MQRNTKGLYGQHEFAKAIEDDKDDLAGGGDSDKDGDDEPVQDPGKQQC